MRLDIQSTVDAPVWMLLGAYVAACMGHLGYPSSPKAKV
jgi:hypothetical protein